MRSYWKSVKNTNVSEEKFLLQFGGRERKGLSSEGRGGVSLRMRGGLCLWLTVLSASVIYVNTGKVVALILIFFLNQEL